MKTLFFMLSVVGFVYLVMQSQVAQEWRKSMFSAVALSDSAQTKLDNQDENDDMQGKTDSTSLLALQAQQHSLQAQVAQLQQQQQKLQSSMQEIQQEQAHSAALTQAQAQTQVLAATPTPVLHSANVPAPASIAIPTRAQPSSSVLEPASVGTPEQRERMQQQAKLQDVIQRMEMASLQLLSK